VPLFWIGGNQSSGGGVTVTVAASDAKASSKNGVDFLCSGTNDDVQIQAAINALPSEGGTIILSEGNYQCGGLITTIPGNILIRGQGYKSTTIHRSTSLGDVSNTLFTNLNGQTMTFRGLNAVAKGDETITLTTGTQEDEFSVGDVINMVSTDNISTGGNQDNGEMHVIRSITTDDSGVITLMDVVENEDWTTPETAAYSNRRAGFTLRDITFTDDRTSAPTMGTGDIIRFRFWDDITIENCQFTGCIRANMNFVKCRNITISNCYMNGVKSREDSPVVGTDLRYGIEILSCEKVMISNINGFDMRHLVTLNPGNSATKERKGWTRNVTVRGCTVNACDAAALEAHEGTKDVVFDANVINGMVNSTDSQGLSFRGKNFAITNNIIIDCATGINIFSAVGATLSGHGVISGNFIQAFERGINVDDLCGDIAINNNNISVSINQVAGIRFSRTGASERAGDNCIVSNNVIDMNGANVDGIDGDSILGMVIIGNIIKNTGTGLMVDIDDTDTRTDFILCRSNTGISSNDVSITNNGNGSVGDNITS